MCAFAILLVLRKRTHCSFAVFVMNNEIIALTDAQLPSSEKLLADAKLLHCEALRIFMSGTDACCCRCLADHMEEQFDWQKGYTLWMFAHLDGVELLQVDLSNKAHALYRCLVTELDWATYALISEHTFKWGVYDYEGYCERLWDEWWDLEDYNAAETREAYEEGLWERVERKLKPYKQQFDFYCHVLDEVAAKVCNNEEARYVHLGDALEELAHFGLLSHQTLCDILLWRSSATTENMKLRKVFTYTL